MWCLHSRCSLKFLSYNLRALRASWFTNEGGEGNEGFVLTNWCPFQTIQQEEGTEGGISPTQQRCGKFLELKRQGLLMSDGGHISQTIISGFRCTVEQTVGESFGYRPWGFVEGKKQIGEAEKKAAEKSKAEKPSRIEKGSRIRRRKQLVAKPSLRAISAGGPINMGIMDHSMQIFDKWKSFWTEVRLNKISSIKLVEMARTEDFLLSWAKTKIVYVLMEIMELIYRMMYEQLMQKAVKSHWENFNKDKPLANRDLMAIRMLEADLKQAGEQYRHFWGQAGPPIEKWTEAAQEHQAQAEGGEHQAPDHDNEHQAQVVSSEHPAQSHEEEESAPDDNSPSNKGESSSKDDTLETLPDSNFESLEAAKTFF
ncbi:hypothetical protein F511_05962 [Dorcoceras hygrometricum]|uniref:Uncharacterized protein n=1 Tax=Dorcoceras hygrometricum TaxID=472368 RepID=A0A2Z7DI08_9LAMI|nr:hypothetical protein F511_05962 [Dorcoceras hygrometricum]